MCVHVARKGLGDLNLTMESKPPCTQTEGAFDAPYPHVSVSRPQIFASGDHRLIGSLLGLTAGAISLAFDESGSRLAVGLADGQVHFVEIEVIPSSVVESSSKGGKTIMVF